MALQDVATVMLATGLDSLLFGLAYIKTRNLMLPAGIHLGWYFSQLQMGFLPVQSKPKIKIMVC